MIDKLPAVGRFLFTDSMLRDGFWRRAGRITRIAGKRIYYNDHHEPELVSDNECYIHEKTLAVVCDTAKEITRLVAFNQRALAEIQALKERHQAQAREFFKP